MTRGAAIVEALDRVRETGRPWVVLATHQTGGGPCDLATCVCAHSYKPASAYDEIKDGWRIAVWCSVNGSIRTMDGRPVSTAEGA